MSPITGPFFFSASLVLIIFHGSTSLYYTAKADSSSSTFIDQQDQFAKTNGHQFALNEKPFYLNGFNAYWMMYAATDPSTRAQVTAAFEQATKSGLNIVRTWAFCDGEVYRSLQVSPGVYNEDTFKGLDFVVSEAKRFGVRVILALVNNFKDYGGRPTYVEWARRQGQTVKDDDDFYTNPVVKQFYKNHVKTVLTRKNTVTGVAYKDDPTIFAWELMNEPRCPSDASGRKLQGWIEEMAAYLKSIDNKHLLEIGLEGFYADSVPARKQYNPNDAPVGTDFFTSNQIPQIDFATIHIYPDQWLPGNTSDEQQLDFVKKWIEAHTQDSDSVLKKPIVIGEFGKSFKLPGYTEQKRNSYFESVYEAIYQSAKAKRSLGGGLFWQLLTKDIPNLGDGYEVVLETSPSTANVVHEQSRKLAALSHNPTT